MRGETALRFFLVVLVWALVEDAVFVFGFAGVL